MRAVTNGPKVFVYSATASWADPNINSTCSWTTPGTTPAPAKTSSTWLSTPQSGGGCTPGGGGGRKAPGQLEDLAGVAVGDPRGHRDAAGEQADADQLGGSTLVIRGEHGAERRDHPVERFVRKRHVPCVTLDPLDVDARVGRASPSVLEELGRDVQTDDVRPAERSRDSDVPSGAGSDVQHVETGTDVDAIEDDLANGLDQPRAAVPVTGGPGRPRALPELVCDTHATKLTRRGQRLDVRLAAERAKEKLQWSRKRVLNNWMPASHP